MMNSPRKTQPRAAVLQGIAAPLVLLVSSCSLGAWSMEFSPGQPVGVIQTDQIREASGIVASRQNRGVLWVHNDSGDSPRVFAITTQAQLLGECHVRGATARDWEDIAIGPGPDPNLHYLYIGDIGDNAGRRRDITVYRVVEPEISATEPFGKMTIGPAEAIRLTYPDGSRDAETLLLDPLTRDLFIISKREFFSRVYRAAYPQSTTEITEMERVATLPWGLATGGDVSPDGRRVIVRSLFNASLWVRPEGEAGPEPLWHAFSGKQVGIPLRLELQGEAIGFDADGAGYFTLSEGLHQPLHYFGPAEPNAPNAAAREARSSLREKHESRNPKSETNSKSKTRMPETPAPLRRELF